MSTPVSVPPRPAHPIGIPDEVEAYTLNNYRLSILFDPNPESPLEWDNLGTMVCWHHRYKLGDEQPKETPEEYMEALPPGTLSLPLYLYAHSGITMSTGPFSCPWDSGQVGFIYITPEKIKKEWGADRPTDEKILEYLRNEVSTYDDFLTGQVYGYKVIHHNGDYIDSCWGFFGIDCCREEALSVFKELATSK